ncbi:50S ribosomal protein L22 [Clostridioides mangenotii]|uniref:50S ribosomal protein L22 n=1 Tax=Metaclostridioides mangenotii TaxID=1540 RepID=UPI001EEEA013|nr:50S ribosomal protein L22 [Clostridioides mangenotii]MCR1954164.1 50S ribosomal protein L22 [Clostridioides mangenotii]
MAKKQVEMEVEREAKATAKYVRVTARKAGEVCELVRGKDVNEALAILKYTPRKAATIIAKVVKSAKANAENNHEMDVDNLYIASIVANQGPTMKRFMPRAMGRATTIRKRTSHIEVVVKEKNNK